MARRKRVPSGTTRRSKKTDSQDTTKVTPPAPVVVQQTPPKEVIEAIQEMPETTTPVAAPAPGKFDHIDRKYYDDAWIKLNTKNPSDIMGQYTNIKMAHRQARAYDAGSEATKELSERVAEMRAIVVALGYPG